MRQYLTVTKFAEKWDHTKQAAYYLIKHDLIPYVIIAGKKFIFIDTKWPERKAGKK